MNTQRYYSQENSQLYRINCIPISGGGMRGLIAAHFLYQLQQYTPFSFRSLDNVNNIFAGSSAGGILSAAYSIGMDAYETESLIEQVGKAIFPEKAGAWAWTKFITNGTPLYDVDRLKEVAHKVFGRMMIDDIKKPIVLTAVAVKGEDKNRINQPVIITNIKKIQAMFPEHYKKPWSVVDAVVSTGNAPIYFNNGIKGWDRGDGWTYMDGGLMNNNPEQFALAAIRSVYPFANFCNILSIGTGRLVAHNPFLTDRSIKETVANLGLFITDVIKYLIDTLTIMPEYYSEINMSLLNSTDTTKAFSYYKFNPFLDRNAFEDIDLDNTKPEFLEYMRNVTVSELKNNLTPISQQLSRFFKC